MGLAKPFEVSIEVNSECNYRCGFCFAKNFPQRRESPGRKHLEQIIKKIAREGIDRIRFTGGEPLLRKDLPGLVSLAKRQGLFTSLNTNGALLSGKKISELSESLDDALVSVHSSNVRDEERLCNRSGVFEKKLDAIRQLSEQGTFVRAATILSRGNISNLENFHSLIKGLPISQWVLLRPIPNPLSHFPVSNSEIEAAVKKVLEFNKGKKASDRTLIENALPFCSYIPEKVSKVALGGIREDGHSSLFIDSSLSIRPSYFLDVNLGNALKVPIMQAWNSDFMKRMHALEFIAEQCHSCKYVKQCMGGSRFSALLVHGSLYALDPLAMPWKFIS